MEKTILVCDCCGIELDGQNDYELQGVLVREGVPNITPVDESQTIDIDDLCALCASLIYEAINNVMIRKNNEHD
jgi:hypothetical protein